MRENHACARMSFRLRDLLTPVVKYDNMEAVS